MQRQLLISLTISLLYSTFLYGEKNCFISLHIHAAEYSNQQIKLGHYYGTHSILLDSIKVGKDGTISYSDSVHTGIYLLITPSNVSYEFMVAESGELSLALPVEKDNSILQATGNSISEGFMNYLMKVRGIEDQLDSLKVLSEESDNYSDRIAIQRVSKMVRDSMDIIINEYIDTFRN